MRNRKIYIYTAAIIILAVISLIFAGRSGDDKVVYREVKPTLGTLQISITAVGTVQPQNRLEIKPPIAGRVERVVVKEGQRVRTGQILAFLSSIERAALLDAARVQGEESIRYWEDVYKPTPIISPIDGEVIVRAVEPGQTVSANDVIVVISDRLIIKAQVDETDIGRVRVGQKAEVSLDAYPDIRVASRVDHISYESRLINNVTIYEVEILPEKVPAVFRSGMSATVKIIEQVIENALLLPREAIQHEGGKSYVLTRNKDGNISQRDVSTAASDDSNVQITSGLGPEDAVLIKTGPAAPSKGRRDNPLVPFGSRKK